MKASKQELRREILALRDIGQQLSNVAYNWAQGTTTLSEQDRMLLKKLQVKWDAIPRSEKYFELV